MFSTVSSLMHRLSSPVKGGICGILLFLMSSVVAQSNELTFAMAASVDGSDPHQSFTANKNVQIFVYESLTMNDENSDIVPLLAESWDFLDETTWEFTLKPGITFSDGTPLTASDAAFSIIRAKNTVGVRTYAYLMAAVDSVEVIDDLTFRIHTSKPNPLLPSSLTQIAIVSEHAVGEEATEEDWNGGSAGIGTGPYLWVRFSPAESVVLERNPEYWGEKPVWDRVTYRFIPNESARVAALLTGEVDVIDSVPPELYDRINSSGNARIVTQPMGFKNILNFDVLRDNSPFVTGLNGEEIQNPLQDLRVRQAIDHAISRDVLAERAMQGAATPLGQFATPGMDGYVEDLVPATYDPALARELLADAGYPEGFALTIHCTNDRFAGDSRSCQTVAQMLAGVGIRTSVEPMPISVYTRRANANELSAFMAIRLAGTGLLVDEFNVNHRTRDIERGLAPQNHTFSNPELDALLAQIEVTFDPEERNALSHQANRLAVELKGRLPLFALNANWGVSNSLELSQDNISSMYKAFAYNMASSFKPVN